MTAQHEVKVMDGCRWMHQAVKADQEGDVFRAHAAYYKTIALFSCSGAEQQALLLALSAVLGGNTDDAKTLIERTHARVAELKEAIMEGNWEMSSNNEEHINEGPTDPEAAEASEQNEPCCDCATPRLPCPSSSVPTP